MPNRRLAVEKLEQRRLLDAKLVMDVGELDSQSSPFGDELAPREIRDVALLQDTLLFYVHYDRLGTGECWQQTGRIWQTAGDGIEQPIDLGSSRFGEWTTAKLGVSVGEKHYFSIEHECVYQSELWSTNGSFGELSQNRKVYEWFLGDISEDSYPPENLTESDGTLFVTAGNVSYGDELWKVDGTTSRASLVKDIHPQVTDYGSGVGAYPAGLTSVNDLLFFTANDGVRGRELWVTDSSANTRLVSDIVPSYSASGGYKELASHDGLLFLSVHDGLVGTELWRSDGTQEGTLLVKDINQGGSSSVPLQLTSSENLLFFVSDDGIHGRELWVSDGSADGTRMVDDLRPGPDSPAISKLTGVGGAVYFVVGGQGDEQDGQELWVSDGTAQGTQRLLGARGAGETVFDQLTSIDGKLFFVADLQYGPRLWQTDGTASGTFMVSGLPSSTSSIEKLVDVSGTLYFTSDSSRKLWQLDGGDVSRWGDVNHDGEINAGDIDEVFDAIGRPVLDVTRDVDLDGEVTERDVETLIREILGTVPGDINLDGLVDESDFAVWSENRFQSNTSWQTGDVNGDKVTDGSDFNILASHRPLSASVFSVPSEVRAGDGPIEIQVRFGARVDQAGIDDQDLIAINSKGDSIPLELVSIHPGEERSTIATYRLTPLDGAWTWDDVVDGYEIVLQDEAVQSLDHVGVSRTSLSLISIQPEAELPSGELIFQAAVAAEDEYATVSIKYADNTKIEIGSFDDQDIVLQNEDGVFSTTFVDSKPDADDAVIATYQVDVPFDLSQVGEYEVRLNSGEVVDQGGNAVPGSVLGRIVVEQDMIPPTAVLDMSEPVFVGDVWRSVVVLYEDDFGIDIGSVEASPLVVTRESNGEVLQTKLLRFFANDQKTQVEAHYLVEADTSAFFAAESVVVSVDGVFDVGNSPLRTGELGSLVLHPEVRFGGYALNVKEPRQVLESDYSLFLGIVFSAFSEFGRVDIPRDGEPDLVVQHQETGRVLQAELRFRIAGVCLASGCVEAVPHFEVLAPSGEWTDEDVGTYRVRLLDGQVFVDGERLPESIVGSFTIGGVPESFVLAEEQLDSEEPQAELLTTQPITPMSPLRVRYTDNRTVSGDSLGGSDLLAVHTSTGKVMEAESFVAEAVDGPFVEYQYRLVKPDGPWALGDFGEYEIRLNALEVFDVHGNSAEAQVLGTVVVEPDTVTTRAIPRNTSSVVYVGQLLSSGFTLDFSPGIVEESTLDDADIRVVNAAGEQLFVELVGATVSAVSGVATNQADYRISPLSDVWQESDVGQYTIYLVENEVFNVSGAAVPAEELGTLSVIHDTTLPFAAIPSFPTNGPGLSATVAVYYQDRPSGIRLSSLDDRDIEVIHIASGDSMPVNYIGDFDDEVFALAATARYQFTPQHVGAYEIRMNPGEVEDLGGLTVKAQRMATFSVVANVVAESPRRSLRSLIGRRST